MNISMAKFDGQKNLGELASDFEMAGCKGVKSVGFIGLGKNVTCTGLKELMKSLGRKSMIIIEDSRGPQNLQLQSMLWI